MKTFLILSLFAIVVSVNSEEWPKNGNEHAKKHIGEHNIEARAAHHHGKPHNQTNEHHVKARAAGEHGKALEHANEHAKSHIGGQTGHAKALEHANQHAKDHIGGHNIETRAAEDENEEEETHNKSQKGAKHQKKEHTKKDKHEKKTHKNEQQDKDVLAAASAHGKALEHAKAHIGGHHVKARAAEKVTRHHKSKKRVHSKRVHDRSTTEKPVSV